MSDLSEFRAGVPGDAVLHGDRVRLEPLAVRHADALHTAARGDPRLWDFLPYGPFPDAAAYRAWVAAGEASADPRFYAIVATGGGPQGVLSFLRIEPAHGSIEIGHIWLGPALQRTPAGTAALYLAARHAFDALGHRRLEWKCDAANARSRRAAERLGFTPEGVFRQHMIVKGRNRDTAWYAILDGEWPAIRRAADAWLDPANFDADGRQRRPLEAFRR